MQRHPSIFSDILFPVVSRRVVIFAAWLPMLCHGQAAVEYAVRKGAGTVSQSSAGLHIGSCKVDVDLLSCISRSYPRAVTGVIAVMCLFLLLHLLAGFARAR